MALTSAQRSAKWRASHLDAARASARELKRRRRLDPEWAERDRQRCLQWGRGNAEKKREGNRAWRQAHAADLRAYNRQWRVDHADDRRAYMKAWYEAHPEGVQRSRQASAAWMREHRDEMNEYARTKYAQNLDAERQRGRERYAANPHAAHERANRRRARLRDAYVENVDFGAVWLRDRGICGICTEPITEKPSLDHVVPLALGGEHSMANVQLAHLDCNLRKGVRAAPHPRVE